MFLRQSTAFVAIPVWPSDSQIVINYKHNTLVIALLSIQITPSNVLYYIIASKFQLLVSLMTL